MSDIAIVTEGVTDSAVIRRTCTYAGLHITNVHGERGKGKIDQSLRAYNHAARHNQWLVVRDLDRDAGCAPALVRSLLPNPSTFMSLRIVVRAMEAWLLGDAQAVARFLHVSKDHIPGNPEQLPNPKEAFVNVARRSRNRNIREDLVPRPNSGSRVGPGYTGTILDFINNHWCPSEAQKRCDSLRRCMNHLASLS